LQVSVVGTHPVLLDAAVVEAELLEAPLPLVPEPPPVPEVVLVVLSVWIFPPAPVVELKLVPPAPPDPVTVVAVVLSPPAPPTPAEVSTVEPPAHAEVSPSASEATSPSEPSLRARRKERSSGAVDPPWSASSLPDRERAWLIFLSPPTFFAA
jgi:hypothetical protein